MDLADVKYALDYLETHPDAGAAEIARRVYCSVYHFQRFFSLMCGISFAEYARCRKLSRAALDLRRGEKVLDVALKYGYGTSESFSRAFFRFHSVKPMQAKRGATVKIFVPPNLGGKSEKKTMNFAIKELPAKTLAGFCTHFHGAPCGAERERQEHIFYERTRGKQWLLFGASGGKETEYAIVSNVTDDGYDYAIAYELDDWTRNALLDPAVTGMDIAALGIGMFHLERTRAAVFTTEKSVHPVKDYGELRRLLLNDVLRDVFLKDAPELVVYHWHIHDRKNRYIEICLPIE